MAGNNSFDNNSRFVTFDDSVLEELVKPTTSKNTKHATKTSVTLLKKFCAAMDSSIDDLGEVKDLDTVLVKFYAGVRKPNGERYKVNSLRSHRFSLQRYFLETRNINIIEDNGFKRCNAVFTNILKETRQAGKGDTDHYPEIEPEDLKLLYNSFNQNCPTGLQEKVWFDIMFHLIRRGRENLRVMAKDSFAIGKDATGKRFVYQKKSENDKNHSYSDDSFATTGEGRIYETGGVSCPVRTYSKYMSLLHPMQPALWQRPRDAILPMDTIWYCSAPLGEKSLGGMMPKLSIKYNLSERYTNHSIRVTSLQVLDDENVEGRHIIRVSGHKSVDSVQNYARRLSASRKRNISSILGDHLATANIQNQQVEIPSHSSSSSTSSKEIENNIVDFNVGNDVADADLCKIPANLLMGSKSFFNPVFSNCKNCSFSFNINMK